MKLKSILSKLKIPEEKICKLDKFFRGRAMDEHFIFPQEIANHYGLNDNLVARILVQLTNEDMLEVYTVPYDRQNNYVAVKYAVEGIVFEFDEKEEVLDEDGEPYDNASLEAVAAYKMVNE